MFPELNLKSYFQKKWTYTILSSFGILSKTIRGFSYPFKNPQTILYACIYLQFQVTYHSFVKQYLLLIEKELYMVGRVS